MASPQIADLPRWQRINALLQQALDLPPDQHERWLEQIAGQQTDVVPILRAMLTKHAVETDTFMNRPVAALWAQAVEATAVGDEPGHNIGPYQLLRELGRGGMGTVWLAQRTDGALQRQVAIKLPIFGWARGVAERLRQERDTLAALEHPNIARLYDAGVTAAGRPYLAMEFVDGVPIDVFAAERRLSLRERLALFLQVASAVTYAHGRLVVHRDLKPTNILVARNGDVRLLDFGAAKLLRDDQLQESALTREVGRALSPDYASPEQIHGESITVACDVYSLGIVLFELMTGMRPYKLKRHTTEALQTAIDGTDIPVASSAITGNPKLKRMLQGDLDNIVAKSLKKSPDQRYATVAAFADDVRRWLNHEPVSARRDSLTYRFGKFVRRNRVAVAAGGLTLVAIAVAGAITTAEMFEARKQRDEARLQAKHAESQQRFANMVMEQFGPNGRPLTRLEMLDRSVDVLEQQYSADPHFIAEALLPIADRYMQLGNIDKEMAVLLRAESIARQLADPLLLIDVNCTAVEPELDQGRMGNAERRMDEARRLLSANPKAPAKDKIDCIDAEAGLADARGDRVAAVARMQEAIALQEQTDRTDRTYRELLAHAQVMYLYAGRPNQAYESAEKLLQVLRETDPRNAEASANALHNQSVALSQMGEVKAAIDREREAVALSTGNDPNRPVLAAAAQLFGRLFTRINDSAEAEAWCERAVAAARAGGNVSHLIHDLGTLAEAQERAGHSEAASDSEAEAVHLLTKSSDPHERTVVARAQAEIALHRRNLSAARTAAAEMLDSLGYPDMEKARSAQATDILLLLASRIAFETGDLSSSERLAADALQIASSTARDPGHSATVGESRLMLARVQYAQGLPEKARESVRGAVNALSAGLSPEHPLTLQAAALEEKLKT